MSYGTSLTPSQALAIHFPAVGTKLCGVPGYQHTAGTNAPSALTCDRCRELLIAHDVAEMMIND
jgi:hypothetical protein